MSRNNPTVQRLGHISIQSVLRESEITLDNELGNTTDVVIDLSQKPFSVIYSYTILNVVREASMVEFI